MLRRKIVLEKGPQFGKLLGKVVCLGLAAVTPQGVALQRGAAGCPADTQVDASGIQGMEHSKSLSDLQWAVVWQHDAARTDPDTRGLGADPRDQNLRRRAGQRFDR